VVNSSILHSPSFPFPFFVSSSHLFSSCIFHVLPPIFVQVIPTFSLIVINLVFNDYTFESKVSIFKLIITMAWNIYAILLLSRTSIAISFTY
jgi:hypothetical protein